MITKVSTANMSREEWLEKRRATIGGSDAAALLGLNKYSSPYSLWAEKTGKITPEDIADKEAVRLGNDLEGYVASRWAEATGKKLRKDNHIIYNDKYPFAHANIDRAVVGENAGLECKTTSSWEILKQCQDGHFPDMWYAQIVHYMMVTEATRWYLGVLVLGKGFYHFCIERDEDEIEALAAAESDFWGHMVNDIAPEIGGSEATQEAIKTIFADSEPGTFSDLTAVSDSITVYLATKQRIKDLETVLNEHQSKIMAFMGDTEKGVYNDVSVSFKTQQRKTFDRKAYEADNGFIDSKYFKVSTSRPFKVTQKGA